MTDPIQLSGFAQVITFLDQFPELRKDIHNELVASALIIVRDAQQAAPVDTGTLRNNISFNDDGDLGVELIAAANYSAYQEFGTGTLVDIPLGFEELAAQAKGDGLRQVNITPHPYLIPAFLAERPLMLERIQELIQERINNV